MFGREEERGYGRRPGYAQYGRTVDDDRYGRRYRNSGYDRYDRESEDLSRFRQEDWELRGNLSEGYGQYDRESRRADEGRGIGYRGYSERFTDREDYDDDEMFSRERRDWGERDRGMPRSRRYFQGSELYGGQSDYRSSYYPSYRRNGPQERGWWDRVSDEVASWFGDEQAEQRRRLDEARTGHEAGEFRGRGPRSYRRSDTRIEEDVNDRLTDDPYLDATEIEVTVVNSEVTLGGQVNSRWAKRLAEELADSVSGVQNVQNKIRINRGQLEAKASPAPEERAAAKSAGTNS